jgi:hypothetical protein
MANLKDIFCALKGTIFKAEVTASEMENFLKECPPDFLFCEVVLIDAKMRRVPDGWHEVSYDPGIARAPWGSHEKALTSHEQFDRDGDGSYFFCCCNKVAVYKYPEHDNVTFEVSAFLPWSTSPLR